MQRINLAFLGTGNAIPTEMRNHTGILLGFKNENILFDCGEGMQRQFRLLEISPAKLTRIFITHWHGDHILGLPGLFQTLAMSNYTRKLKIYGPRGTNHFISIIKELLMHINIELEINEVDEGTVLDEDEFKIEAKRMDHGTPSLAYSFIVKDKLRLNKEKIKKLGLPNLPILKNLQDGKDIIFNKKKIKASSVTYRELGRKITIILDTKMNEKAIELAKNSDLVITESTFSEEEAEKAKEYMHLTAKDAATIAKKSKSKALIITHISQRYEHNLSAIEKEARKTFKNTKIARDLDILEL